MMTAVAPPPSPCLITAKKDFIQVGTLLFVMLSFQMSSKELTALSPSEIGELEATMQNHGTVAPHSHEPLLGKFSLATAWHFGFPRTPF